MSLLSIIMLISIVSIIWGGLFVVLAFALWKEKEKRKSPVDKEKR